MDEEIRALTASLELVGRSKDHRLFVENVSSLRQTMDERGHAEKKARLWGKGARRGRGRKGGWPGRGRPPGNSQQHRLDGKPSTETTVSSSQVGTQTQAGPSNETPT